MAEIITLWSDGDIITAEKMNNIENGIAGGGGSLIVTAEIIGDYEDTMLSVSYNDLVEAISNGILPLLYREEGYDDEGAYYDYTYLNALDYTEIVKEYSGTYDPETATIKGYLAYFNGSSYGAVTPDAKLSNNFDPWE